jgi:hypothetical protein
MLEIAHRLNEQCIALLAEKGASHGTSIQCNPLSRFSELWARIDHSARVCAARCPVLLFDLNFDRADWWFRATQPAAGDARPLHAESFFPEPHASAILREILTEAWSGVRSMPFAVSIVFGMTYPVCTTIAGLTIPDIDRLVHDHARDLRPRWSENSYFWRGLLNASIAADEDALVDHHLYCLQLLVSNLESRHQDTSNTINRRWGS